MIDDRYHATRHLPRQPAPFIVRMLRPDDKAALLAGFERLSPASRYRRFFAVKKSLSPAELTFLTEFDGHDHFALGVFEPGEAGRCVAVARMVRTAPGSEVAELALVVADDLQGQGLGRHLLELLLEGARERGVRRIHVDLQIENEAMRNLIGRLAPDVEYRREGEVLSGELEVPAPADAPGLESALKGLLRLAAGGGVYAPVLLGQSMLLRGLDQLSKRLREPPPPARRGDQSC